MSKDNLEVRFVFDEGEYWLYEDESIQDIINDSIMNQTWIDRETENETVYINVPKANWISIKKYKGKDE